MLERVSIGVPVARLVRFDDDCPHLASDFGRSIRRTVADDDFGRDPDFADPPLDHLDAFGDPVLLVERRHDDAQCWCRIAV